MNIKHFLKDTLKLSALKSRLQRLGRRIASVYYKRELINRTFTLIFNNCWAGFIYQRYGLPYYTPFIGLFVPAPCYIELLEHFDDYMARPLEFIAREESVYYPKIKGVQGKEYPIARLGEKVEIHFLHEKNAAEAAAHWNRRKERIHRHNMLVKFSEIDCCTPELVARFDALPFPHKICFVVHSYPQLSSVLMYPDKRGLGETFEEWKYPLPDLTQRLNGLQREETK